jgi:hypothetical protein
VNLPFSQHAKAVQLASLNCCRLPVLPAGDDRNVGSSPSAVCHLGKADIQDIGLPAIQRQSARR